MQWQVPRLPKHFMEAFNMEAATLQTVVWTIAGFDPSGGAGILADCHTLSCYKVIPFAITTALTAQNGLEVTNLEPVHSQMITAQLLSLKKLGWPKAIKIGLLPNDEVAETIFNLIHEFNGPIIHDPVMISSSGRSLITSPLNYTKWIKATTVLTPNVNEAEILTGKTIISTKDMIIAADLLCQLGAKNVILTGGHLPGGDVHDLWTNGKDHAWRVAPRIPLLRSHGTGCVFSSALAAHMACGYSIQDAFPLARKAVRQSIESAYEPFPDLKFARMQKHDPALGFYPIVDSVKWVERLIGWGVKTIQLRLKDKSENTCRFEIKQAIEMARRHHIQLFINDYWELALEYQAYGVHLGQTDLDHCDLLQLQKSGLRIGISTHNEQELERALALKPFYIAFGPIYTTRSKKMPFPPQGIAKLTEWRQRVSCPLVAIGGINLENVDQILSCHVDGVAVISAVTQSNDPFTSCQQFMSKINPCTQNMLVK
ncbi:MAG: thiamine phosphate synthase [Candidatus Berkiellales bacterium]